MTEQSPFKWRHFQADMILLSVRWYLRYALSYRDLEEIMLERGLQVDHTTIYRWAQQYALELEKRCRPHLKPTNDSWRVDETTSRSKKCVCICIARLIRMFSRLLLVFPPTKGSKFRPPILNIYLLLKKKRDAPIKRRRGQT